MTAQEARRPGVITAVAVLCWVVGALELAVGALFLALAAVPGAFQSTPTGSAVAFGAGYLLAGLAYLLVGFGVVRGADLARVIVLLVSVLNLAIGLFTAISGQPLAGILSMGIAVAIALPMWVGRGREWFERRRNRETAHQRHAADGASRPSAHR